ncbi:MAG: ExbD/TolR family protein [Bacillota bacterium]
MFHRSTKRKSEVKILPMIDVLFFLLIFFMLFTTFRTTPSGLDINLPQAETVTQQKQDQVVVNLSAKGEIYLKDQLLTKADLRSEVASQLKDNSETVVIIKADRAVKYDKVVEVMDILREIGAHRLALAADSRTNE